MNFKKLTRRAVVAGLPLAPALVTARASAQTVTSLTFLAVGDWGRDGASHQRDVAAAMGRAASERSARCVISVGDNFYENGVQSADDPQWRTSFEAIYTAPSLQTPWYALLGNHDYRGTPQAQIDYAARSSRWRMPSRYYMVSGGELGAPHVDLFFLDTSPLVHSYREHVEQPIARNVATQDPSAQLTWLDAALGQSQAKWKLVFGHHTIFSGGSAHGNTPELIQQIKPILDHHGVNAYINGHEHDLQHIHIDGGDYICTGAGSEVRPTGSIEGTRFCLSRSGFAVFAVSNESMDLEFVDYSGASLYRTSLPARPVVQPT